MADLHNIASETGIVIAHHLPHTVCHIQEISDARLIRNRILKNFELATQQATSEEERRRLLHFVIVGGGPTGVEFGAEFYDFLKEVCTCMCQAVR